MIARILDSTADTLSNRPIFNSFFMGGFECACQRLRSGRRLDLVHSTQHDKFAMQDYLRLKNAGMRVAREGVRWHVVEEVPGRFDFSSVRPIFEAAQATETQVIWDMCHFGWPDRIDIFKPEFISGLARLASEFAAVLAKETNLEPFFVPVNEISFFSWAGGDEGGLNPHATGRGFELKCQLVRAAIAVMEAIWAVVPHARFVHVDPVINVVAHPDRPEDRIEAEKYRRSQYQGWDMLAGRLWPELGGQEKYLDIMGVNYYFHNQWIYDIKGTRRTHEFKPIKRTSPLYRPFREILRETYDRYRRPMFIAETGAERKMRGPWLKYVTGETEAAILDGVPVDAMCLYPILNHPGWLNDRHCYNALWDYPDEHGNREIYTPLARQLKRSQKILETRPWKKLTGSAEPTSASRTATRSGATRPVKKAGSTAGRRAVAATRTTGRKILSRGA